ncbi:MAG: hypothetical protein DHS20C18_43020 [Saprospiraceae bacterium]|nr:MAG: hypothetical protein DHS20C18_43020 [Saprospiraceae bacterium]
MERTLQQYNRIMAQCRELFIKKTQDYGTSWRILRPSSITDQLFIKAKRIRSIEEKGEQKINDSIDSEYIALVNYSIIALIQLDLPDDAPLEMQETSVSNLYDQHFEETRQLMLRKNHDYGEVWREMRISSITDLILSKLLRIKQIEDNQGQTLVSEGVEGNYHDIINYAIFALIQIEEQKNN